MRWCRELFVLSDERNDTSVQETFDLLQTTYWAHKRPVQIVEQIIDRSLCFYLRRGSEQIGFARVITDHVTTSWIADAVLHGSHRNQGLGTWMMKCILEHPDISQTQFVLQTGTAHVFYERLGFSRNKALMSTPVDYL